ncbi:MAG TPA: hypothetical protein VHU80_05570 [Polyangiaceae bacterium]|jgi:hypothetical protein|nr:hypothetical protein [Polyangiaceae bacterium]
MKTMRRTTPVLVTLVFALVACTSCGIFRGAINDSPSIRWFLFSTFGAGRVCPEMLKHGAPLQLVPGGETLGRFFPNGCRVDMNGDTQTITLHFTGTGYAWTPIAGRMGFSVEAAIEYRPDFRLESDAMYVWARYNRVTYGPIFSIGSIENKLADWAARTPAGYFATTFGSQIVQSQLASGFTVVRTDQGDDFSLGILNPPQRPTHPFAVSDSDHVLLESETTDVRPNQVDFLGPFEVGSDDQALFLHFKLTGPAVDILVVSRNQADPWREAMQQGTPLGPPASPPVQTFVVQPGQDQTQRVRLPAGQYYVVVDNSNLMGSVAPPWTPMAMLGGGAAVLAYSVELGDSE